MLFCDSLENNLDKLEEYHFLEDEMSKYKTLNHENIAWDRVYESSQDILKSHSIDLKFCTYFFLACLHLNNEKCFHQLLLLVQHLKYLSNRDNYFLKSQKKKIQNFIENFITEYNKTEFSLTAEDFKQFSELFKEFETILNCKFSTFQIKQTKTIQPFDKSQVDQVDINIKSDNINLLNEREYKNFCQKLAFEILDDDENNLNAYALFTQAMWGKIKKLPENNDGITRLRHPDVNLIQFLLEKKANEKEHIKCFMSNLILNPFWIEGIKLFCEFLEKHEKILQLEILMILTKAFVSKFENITKLRFEGGELFCKEEIYSYFIKQNIKESYFANKNNKDNEKGKKNLEQILIDIDRENHNNSLMHNINSLIELAKVFEDKGMRKNAKIFYLHLVELMEKTLLKEYLYEEYNNAKEKIK
ncbi:type VI secretion system domain-containing protein [Campylobacter aviculae]|uniref:Nucleobase:cation symporter n=1 Tax=Campylobacter aviculae TaxID=2510190 RepID=A0A4U7BNX3_9BACT|nr:type VI secretion system domain-containing protein [Campylobacter aviculae]TKX30616.1 nucleobase:cation symporter [Campylobacter aviculae]